MHLSKSTFPKVIYMCNKTIGPSELMSSNNWKKLNDDYEIKLYDDEMIKLFLLQDYGELYKNIFEYLKQGPIKADFWRICILYKNGGVYSDIDNMPLVPLNEFIENDIDFVTCSSYWQYNFNPNLIISSKDNIILKKCIDWYIKKYNNRDPYSYWGWSIMNVFTQTLHLENYKKDWGIYKLNDMKIQIIKECNGPTHYDAHNIYNNIKVFNNRLPNWDYSLHEFKP
jgi:mannosyltransferase OCH1-like enzyme